MSIVSIIIYVLSGSGTYSCNAGRKQCATATSWIA